MSGPKMLCLGVALLALAPGAARAQHGHGGGGMHGGGGGMLGGGGGMLGGGGGMLGGRNGRGMGNSLAAVGSFPGFFFSPYYVTIGPGGYANYAPGMVMGPGGFGYGPMGMMPPPAMGMRGPLLPPPPRALIEQQPQPKDKPAPVPSDPARARQLMTIGDRLFRAGNLKKAEERYRQAIRASSQLAAPRVRLAQVALVRGRYAVAADWLRQAETAQPGWLGTATDIQAIYGEPTEFARQIARLESHVQIHPDDRDAWLLLGAEWFLSGRTARAADVFLRINDPNRKPDVALTAFLDASNQLEPAPEDKPPDELRDQPGPR